MRIQKSREPRVDGQRRYAIAVLMQRDAVAKARLDDDCRKDLGRQPDSQRMKDCCGAISDDK